LWHVRRHWPLGLIILTDYAKLKFLVLKSELS